MKNPFEYGGVVSGHAFCNRDADKNDLLRGIRNNEKLFVFSERRFGKTSLVLSVIAKLPQKHTVSAYVDLWPTDDEPSFVAALAKAVTSSMSTSAEKMLTTAKALFSSLVPTMTLNDDGKPELSFGFSKNVKIDRAIISSKKGKDGQWRRKNSKESKRISRKNFDEFRSHDNA
jgi:hypothetical protein